MRLYTKYVTNVCGFTSGIFSPPKTAVLGRICEDYHKASFALIGPQNEHEAEVISQKKEGAKNQISRIVRRACGA